MKTVMKRLFSLMLVAVLLVSAVPTAFADVAATAPCTTPGHESLMGTYVSTSAEPTCSAEGAAIYNCIAPDGEPEHTFTVVLPKLKHSWIPATCTERQTCRTCGGHTGELAPHTEVIDQAVAATCRATGLTEGKHCSVCGEVLVAQTVVDKLAHTEVIDEAVAATCKATGLTEGKHCSVCNTVITAQTVVPLAAHTWDNATCNEPKTCSVCGAVDGENNGHTWVLQSETAPTCTEAGQKLYNCGVCGVPKTETIPYLGHNIGSEGKCLREGCPYTENTRYAVEFYKNYNENNDPVTKFVAKGTKVYSIYTPYRDGYSFEGWYTVSGSRVSESATVTGDSAYFAKWTQNAPHEVYVKFYTHGNTKNVVKYVDMHHYAHDGVISLDDLMTVAKKNFKARGNESLYIQGPFTSSEWDIFCDNSAYRNTSEKIEVSQTSTTVIHAMVRNVDDSKTSSSSSKADSSNPKTGDMIFAPVAVMGLSVSALAVLFYLNKKRAY